MVMCLQEDLARKVEEEARVAEEAKLGDVKQDGTVETLKEKLERQKVRSFVPFLFSLAVVKV